MNLKERLNGQKRTLNSIDKIGHYGQKWTKLGTMDKIRHYGQNWTQ